MLQQESSANRITQMVHSVLRNTSRYEGKDSYVFIRLFLGISCSPQSAGSTVSKLYAAEAFLPAENFYTSFSFT
jgi:hypothetical protein